MPEYRLAGYHGQRRPWRTRDHVPDGQLAGIELELEHPVSAQRILNALPKTSAALRPCTERDASLDHTGVEIIFPPYKYSTIRNGRSFIANAMRKLEESGAIVSRRTGMHVNINTTGWGVGVRRAFVGLTNGLGSTKLEAIGGRRLTMYCAWVDMDRQWFDMQSMAEETTSNHHTAVNIMPNRLELRFPAATTDPRKLRIVITFAEYMEKYARSRDDVHPSRAMMTLCVDRDDRFLNFLKAQPKNKSLRELIKVIQNAR